MILVSVFVWIKSSFFSIVVQFEVRKQIRKNEMKETQVVCDDERAQSMNDWVSEWAYDCTSNDN